jgi:hypothetical protein
MLLRRVLKIVLTFLFEIVFPCGIMYLVGLMPMWFGVGSSDDGMLHVYAGMGGAVTGLLLAAWMWRAVGPGRVFRFAQLVAIGGGMSLGSFQGAQWWQPQMASDVPWFLVIGFVLGLTVGLAAILRMLCSAPQGDGY